MYVCMYVCMYIYIYICIYTHVYQGGPAPAAAGSRRRRRATAAWPQGSIYFCTSELVQLVTVSSQSTCKDAVYSQ